MAQTSNGRVILWLSLPLYTHWPSHKTALIGVWLGAICVCVCVCALLSHTHRTNTWPLTTKATTTFTKWHKSRPDLIWLFIIYIYIYIFIYTLGLTHWVVLCICVLYIIKLSNLRSTIRYLYFYLSIKQFYYSFDFFLSVCFTSSKFSKCQFNLQIYISYFNLKTSNYLSGTSHWFESTTLETLGHKYIYR